ncbi:MAG TPA: bifunctional hydroxymethylpyrimidine kinase/phosphomethylpyrimidine kinase [Phycisphaerae bacterium]|nr:bifunctional hydroxymethylpyrimidine kinase/phosphomethylpyrimidine kinase [Phycisphaerae bacterium]
MTPVALTIAGSDPSGGAGLQADLKTFHQLGVYGTSVVTLLTVQNTRSVDAVEVLDPAFAVAQLEAVLSDIPPQAAKTGALGSAAMIEALADRAASFAFPLVVDPVMISKHGAPLIDAEAVAVLRDRLLPHATVVTPNLHEAAALTGMEVTDPDSMERAAKAIAQLGPKHVVIKGGRLEPEALDVLWSGGGAVWLRAARVESQNTHGSGCVFSAAIAAGLARGLEVEAAVRAAKEFVTAAIRTAPGLGAGVGPTNLHAAGPLGSKPQT